MQAQYVEKNVSEIQSYVNEIFDFVVDNASKYCAHEMEEEIKKKILSLGCMYLETYFSAKGTGDKGKTLEVESGIYHRESRLYPRQYYSIFGKIKVKRTCYKKIGEENIYPLDIEANLPDRSYSYVLQELMNLESLKHPYGDSSETIEKFLGLDLSVNSLETVSAESSVSYGDFYDNKEVEAATLPVMTASFDGKGIPMIGKEDEAFVKRRLGKGEKRGKKKEALAGVCYESERKLRVAEEVASNLVFGKQKDRQTEDQNDAKAQNIRRIASIEKSKKEVVKQIKQEVEKRDPNHNCRWAVILDGARGLWLLILRIFKGIDFVPILDIIHVTEYLWDAGHAFFSEKSPELPGWIYEKLVEILKGNVSKVIKELKQKITQERLKGNKRKQVQKTITYFENHKKWMKYDQYLKEGLPIASGVVESTCGHLIKDRMERAGCRWNIKGAEAVLKLRSIKTSKDWDQYWQYHISQEKERIHTSKIAA
jgi:hypothetical protein